jgi:predicted nucleic acid-binding protein
MRINYSFDTNILIYSADQGTGEKHIQARELLRRAHLQKNGSITEQSIFEFLYVASRKLPLSFAEAGAFVEDMLTLFDLLLPKKDLVNRVLALLKKHRLSVWNARILALCGANDCAVLFSEDMQDHGVYDDVRVINPFRAANAPIVEDILNA